MFKKSKYIYLFLVTVILFGLLIGILSFVLQDTSIKDTIKGELNTFNTLLNNRNNNIIFHTLIIAGISILGITVIGTPLNVFYLFYEGLSIGYLISSFTHTFKFKGLLFSLLFIILIKLFYLLLCLFCTKNSIDMSKNIGLMLLKKNNKFNNNYFRNYLIRIIIIVGICFINDLIIYFFGNKLLKLFLFLL